MLPLGITVTEQGQAQSDLRLHGLRYLYAQATDLGFIEQVKNVPLATLWVTVALLGMVILYKFLPSLQRRFDAATDRRLERNAKQALDHLDGKLNGSIDQSKFARIVRDELRILLKDPQGSVSNAIGEIARHKIFSSDQFVLNVQRPIDRLMVASEDTGRWKKEREGEMNDLERRTTRLEVGIANFVDSIAAFRKEIKEGQADFHQQIQRIHENVTNVLSGLTKAIEAMRKDRSP